jgi:HAD superfamily hydrolase (TIGR01509 family)
MSVPALVLFDLDGVLAHYRHDIRVDTLAARTGADPAQVEEQLFGSGLEYATDLGDFDAEGHVAELASRLGCAVTLDDCLAARAESMAADPDVLALSTAVAAVARVAILTNNGLMLRDHLPALCPPLFPLFAGRVYCSAQYRVGKPDTAVFAACLHDLGIAAADTLFVDDKAENVEGARRAGLHAHHFTTADALRAELRRHGLPARDATPETPA